MGASEKPQALKDRQKAKEEEMEVPAQQHEPLCELWCGLQGSFFDGVPTMQSQPPKPKKPLPSDWTKGGGGKKSNAPVLLPSQQLTHSVARRARAKRVKRRASR